MQHYEYTVIAAPDRGSRAKGGKTPTDRYAAALAQVLNQMAEEGWDYVRAETLPSDERSGIASRQTLWHNVLVFRRDLTAAILATQPPTVLVPEPVPEPAPVVPSASVPPPTPAPAKSEIFTQPPLRKQEPVTEPSPPASPRLGPAAR